MNRLFVLALFSAACDTQISNDYVDLLEEADSTSLGRVAQQTIRCGRDPYRMPERGIVMLGTDDAAVGTIKCASRGSDDEIVSRVVLQGCVSPVGTPTDGDCTDPNESVVPNGVINLVHLEFPNSGGGRSIEGRVMTDGVVTFDPIDAVFDGGAGPGQFGPLGLMDVTFDVDGFAGLSGALVQLNVVEVSTTAGHSVNKAIRLRQHLLAAAELGIDASSTTPSGAATSGPNTPVFEFEASSEDGGDAQVTKVTFAIAAIDAGTPNWNDCDGLTALSNPAGWSMLDEHDDVVTGAWNLIAAGDGSCAFAEFTPDSLVVFAGQENTYSVLADTSGTGTGDSLTLSIPHESITEAAGLVSLVWGDGIDPNLSSVYVQDLPVLGDEITF